MDDIKINTKFADKNGEIMIVEISGHVDQSNSHTVQKNLNDIIESGVYKIVFDFEKLYYMSSAGWGIFVGEVKRFRDNGGDIKLSNMNPDINDVFQMLEFYHILEDYSSVKEAAVSFFENSDPSSLIIDIDTDDVEQADEEAEADEADVEEAEVKKTDRGKNDTKSKKDTKIKKDTKSKVIVEEDLEKSNVTVIDFKPNIEETLVKNEKISKPITQEFRLSELPLSEKVLKIVAENPLLSPFGIKKVLKHQHFGYTKIGIFKLLKLLRTLDLDTKEKRYRYYRSC